MSELDHMPLWSSMALPVEAHLYHITKLSLHTFTGVSKTCQSDSHTILDSFEPKLKGGGESEKVMEFEREEGIYRGEGEDEKSNRGGGRKGEKETGRMWLKP